MGPQVEQEWLTGTVVRYDDVNSDPRADTAAREIYAARHIAAFVSVPLLRGTTVQAILSAQCGRPRVWRDAETALIRDVGDRLWPILERARAQAELQRRDRDQRFVIEWSDSVRAESAPERILDTTLTMLGEHLGCTRMAYATIDLDGGQYRIVAEWCRGVAPTLGQVYPSSNLSEAVRSAYLAGETLVSPDLRADQRFSAAARESFARKCVVARIGVPLSRDNLVHGVLSADADHPREWCPSEARLVRDIAERMWVLLHRAEAEAALKERERNQALLIAWNDRISNETSERAILATTLKMIGAHLDVNRAVFVEADLARDVLVVLQDWCQGTFETSGRKFQLPAVGQRLADEHVSGSTIVVGAVDTDPRLRDADLSVYAGLEIAAFMSVPLVRHDVVEGVLSIQSKTPRAWTSEEAQLLRDLAHRTWAVLERARAEERRADTEASLNAFMDNAPFGMHLQDAEGRYLRINPELARQVARPVDQLVGRTTDEILPEEIASRVLELEQRARAGRIATAEFLLPERTSNRALVSVMFPIGGPCGVARTGGFTLDLTARKAAEAALQESREALHQSEKLTALGSLLAGVSHELNNPLSIVVAQASMLERQAKDGPLADRAFKIRRAADRCARIVETFLSLARQKPPARAPVDLNAVVEGALDLAGYGLRTDGIAVVFERAPQLPAIGADADQLHQVIINLLINAQQALAGQVGARTLTVTTAQGDEPSTVVVDVADNGPGVPDDAARRIFEPFFTTKKQGEGTGLGLSFSQGIAEAHGGKLTLRPTETGACFRLTLPTDPEQDTADIGVGAQEADAPPPRRALLVDDEEEIADALGEFLALEAFACDIATSGAQACQMMRATAYDLVVSDLRMPQMDGPALHAWIARERPTLCDRVGFVTGDTFGAQVADFLANARRPVLEKPFTPEKVERFLSEMGVAVRPG